MKSESKRILDTEGKPFIENYPNDNIMNKVDVKGLKALGGSAEMKKRLDEFKEKQAVINDFIDEFFVEGEDFGPADDRNPKPVLLKGGAEKAVKMFGTHATWKRDDQTWEMAGNTTGTICMICYIIDDETGAIIGEGRGSDLKGNKGRDLNKAIKNAEKSALVDAALYTFMLSNRFTQEGKNKRMILYQWKQDMLNDISNLRAGVKSELTDLEWLTKALEFEIHKKRMDTLGEHNHMRKVIFEEKRFNFSTGELNKRKTEK